MVMTDILSPIFRWVIEVFKDEEYKEPNFVCIVIFKGIGFAIIIISALIFNEILVLHFFQFDKYIEDNISKRGEAELRESNETGTLSLSKDDDENVTQCRTYETELSSI